MRLAHLSTEYKLNPDTFNAMPKLTKRQRDALKASGEWTGTNISGTPFNGAFEFARLAAEANQTPVPSVPDNWAPPAHAPFQITLDHEMFGEAAERFAQSGDFYEYVDEMYDGSPTGTTSDGCFFDALMQNAASRVIHSSGLSEVSNTWQIPDLPVPKEAGSFLEYMGAFEDDKGLSADYIDPSSLTKTLLWCAEQCVDTESAFEAISRMWLPTSPNDGNFQQIMANRLAKYLHKHGVYVGISQLSKTIQTGVIPDCVEKLIDKLPDEHKELIPQIFWTHKDAPAFHKFFGSKEFQPILDELGLKWKNPSPTHLCFNRSIRDLTKRAVQRWEKRKFYTNSDSVFGSDVNESFPHGSPLQLILRSKEKGECYAPKGFATQEDIMQAYSHSTHAVVVGPELDLVSFKFNPMLPLQDWTHHVYRRDSMDLSEC